MTNVRSSWSTDTSISGRTVYYIDQTFTTDISMEWKFSTSIPTRFVMGFSQLYPFNAKGYIYRYDSSNYWFSYSQSSANQEVNLGISPTTSNVFRLESENIDRIYAYLDSTTKAYRDTMSTVPLRVRVDEFSSVSIPLDYLKIKPKASA